MEKPCSAAIPSILFKPAAGKPRCFTRKSQAHLALVYCPTQENEAGVTHVPRSPYKPVVSIRDHLWRWGEAPLTSLRERTWGLRKSAVCLLVPKGLKFPVEDAWLERALTCSNAQPRKLSQVFYELAKQKDTWQALVDVTLDLHRKTLLLPRTKFSTSQSNQS